MAGVYDVIVIGAGPTGENVADRAVKGGLSAAIVESELVGGECSYWACMPSKALLRPIAATDEARHVEGVIGARLDPPAVLARRDMFANGWKDDRQVAWLEGAHVDLFRGVGRITDVRSVKKSCGPGTRSWSALAAGPSSRRSPAWPRRGRGPAVRRRARTRYRDGSPSSAAAWSAARWPPRGRRSARRSRCSRGTGCWTGWRTSPVSWWRTG